MLFRSFGGDQGAYGGVGGTCLGSVTQLATGNTPYIGPYYAGNPAQGGLGGQIGGYRGKPGTAGYAVMVFDINGQYVKTGGNWTSVSNTYVKKSGSWTKVKETYVKQNGVWKPILNSQATAPAFTNTAGKFGISYRPYS